MDIQAKLLAQNIESRQVKFGLFDNIYIQLPPLLYKATFRLMHIPENQLYWSSMESIHTQKEIKELSFNKFPVCPRSPFTLSLSKGRATGLRQAQPERILG